MENGKTTRLVALTVIAAAYVPLLWLHVRRLWSSDQYQYLPLIPVAVIFLAWVRFRPRAASQEAKVEPGIQWLVVALVTLAAAVVLWSPWLAALSFLAFAYYALRLLAAGSGQSPVPVWALLLLLLPLPFRWDERLIFWVQGVASDAASSLLDFFAVNHLLSGHVLQVPGREFAVAVACGGLVSFFSLIALAAMIAVLLRRSLTHATLLLIAGGFWAAVVGALRLTCVVVLHTRYSIDATAGLEKRWLEIGSLLLAVVMLLCTERFLVALLTPVEEDLDSMIEEDDESAAPLVRRSAPGDGTAKPVIFLGSCFALLGVMQIVGMFRGHERQMESPDHGQLAAALTASLLPEVILDREQVAFAVDRDSVCSATWDYMGDGGPCAVQFDFPLAGWQYLTAGYEARGWEVMSREVLCTGEETRPETPSLVRTRLIDHQGNRGLLLVCQLEQDGRAVVPPGTAGLSLSSWISAVRHRLKRRLGDLGYERTTYQIQVLLGHSPPQADLQPTDSEALRAFLQVRQRLRRQLIEAKGGNHE
jgi:exosortase